MKKIIFTSLFVAFATTLVFAAPKKSGRIELKIWESSGPESAFIQAAIKEYRTINPKVKIIYEPVESTDARNKIEMDGPAGVGADIFVAPHDHIGALVAGQHILPVEDAETYMNDFLPLAKKAATFDGVIYGYPLGAETYVLYYNKDVFPEPPSSWEEIIEFAKTWNKPVEGKYAIAWNVSDPYYAYMFIDSFGAPLFGEDGNNPKQHNLNSPGALKGLTFMQNLRKQVLNLPAMDLSRDFCHASFAEGKTPLIITGSWKINEFKKLGLNFGITTLPSFPMQKDPATSFSGVRLAFVSSYSEHPEEAMEFVRFLTSQEMLGKRFEMTDQYPPRRDIRINNKYINPIVKQLNYSKPMPTITQLGTYWRVMGPAISGIWEGDDVIKTLEIVTKQMDAVR